MRKATPARLDPVRRLPLPRRPVLVRAGIAAALLLTAAGVLYSGEDRPEPVSPVAARPSPTASDPEARLPIPAGMVGVPVPIGDPASLTAVVPGDRVDLLAVPASDSLATAATVLAVDPGAASLLLALTPAQGRAVLAASATTSFAILVRPGSGSAEP
jgi:hypothetical protein